MENNKKSIWKKIAAILMSAMLVFSRGSVQQTLGTLDESKKPVVSSEMTNNEKKDFYSVARHYPDFKMVAEDIVPLNGIMNTSVGNEKCDTMVPQGLAVIDDIILITAYDGIDDYKEELRLHSYKKECREKLEEENDHKPHNSVIYAIDKEDRKIITALELPDQNHVGGIAVRGNNIYIAKSTDKQISVIPISKIKEEVKKAKETGEKVTKIDYSKTLDCNCIASFITTKNSPDGKKQLVVGTWRKFPNSSSITIFDVNENDQLEFNQRIGINSSANGATFIEKDGKEYLMVASSIGRTFNSNLYIYEVNYNKKGKIRLDSVNQISLPPMAEEIVEIEGTDGKQKLAIGTEIMSKRYEIGRPKIHPKGIAIADLDAIFDIENQKREQRKKTEIDANEAIIEDVIIKREEDEHEK